MLFLEKNAIFIHIPKTAGQSIEDSLLEVLGKNRSNDGPDHLLRFNPDRAKGPKRLAHLRAEEYTSYSYVSESTFQSAFTFSFVRNPFERVVSFYKYLNFSPWISFSTFAERYLPKYFQNEYWFLRPQTDFIYDKNDTLLIDFVGRFESLNSDFTTVLEKIDCTNAILKKKNVSSTTLSRNAFKLLQKHPEMLRRLALFSKNKGSYQSLYSPAARKNVTSLYQRDLELLDYDF